jgi:hypothetical protein
MVSVDLYFPVMLGLDIRLGRFISIPDIEAQLAPNNYTNVHSLTYTFDILAHRLRNLEYSRARCAEPQQSR